MMPLKKERWASIRSVKLYHEGEGIIGFLARHLRFPVAICGPSRSYGNLGLTVQYGRNRDIRERRINALVRDRSSLKQSC